VAIQIGHVIHWETVPPPDVQAVMMTAAYPVMGTTNQVVIGMEVVTEPVNLVVITG